MPGRKRAGGRPPKAPEERKSINLTIRSRHDFRTQLERAAVDHRRSISEETEARLLATFEADEIDAALHHLPRLIRWYFSLLEVRKRDALHDFDLRDPAAAHALRTGLDLLVTAICSGPLSEERVKDFWIETAKIRRESGAPIAQIATEAFHVVVRAKLAAEPDRLELMEWVRAEMQNR